MFFIGPIRDLLSQLKKENKYSYFKIRNFVKLANHRMTYIRRKYPKNVEAIFREVKQKGINNKK